MRILQRLALKYNGATIATRNKAVTDVWVNVKFTLLVHKCNQLSPGVCQRHRVKLYFYLESISDKLQNAFRNSIVFSGRGNKRSRLVPFRVHKSRQRSEVTQVFATGNENLAKKSRLFRPFHNLLVNSVKVLVNENLANKSSLFRPFHH